MAPLVGKSPPKGYTRIAYYGYPVIFDIKILINTATANAAINAIIFVKGHGILPNLEFALLILNFPSNPVVYSGNINTVTYINASLIP